MINVSYNLHTGEININTRGDSRVVLLVKRLPGKEFHKDKYWRVPIVNGTSLRSHLENFIANVKDLQLEIEVDEEVWTAVDFAENWRERNYNLSTGTDYVSEIYTRLFDGDLSGPQRVTVEYMSTNGAVICGDPETLNPRTSALAAIERELKYPALVVCSDPAKILWAREFKQRTRRFVYMMGIDVDRDFIHEMRIDAGSENMAELGVINFGNLEKYRAWLGSTEWQVLIIDEAHYIKSTASVQATILLDLARTIPKKILLSQTDIHARPWELLAQLEILGKLGEFGGREKFIHDYTVKGSESTVWKPCNTDKLEKALREVCYVAHKERQEVMG
jgi:hypothetical protein